MLALPATALYFNDPRAFFLAVSSQHPSVPFYRLLLKPDSPSSSSSLVVICDESLYAPLLVEAPDVFGDNLLGMEIQKTLGNSVEDIQAHSNALIGHLRRLLIAKGKEFAEDIAQSVSARLASKPPQTPQTTLRALVEYTSWAMTEKVFGVPEIVNPDMYRHFLAFDDNLGRIIRGALLSAEVKKSLQASQAEFRSHFTSDQQMSVIDKMALNQTNNVDVAARFVQGFWWGSQGNTLGSVYWTLGHILANESFRQRALREAASSSSDLPFLTACFKEALRLYTHSVAYRVVVGSTQIPSFASPEHVLTLVPGDVVCIPFCLAHFNPAIYSNPTTFNPDRFLTTTSFSSTPTKSTEINPSSFNGHRLAFLPFSSGEHRCPGSHLAMEEVPRVLRTLFLNLDMRLADPSLFPPPLDGKKSFGVIAPVANDGISVIVSQFPGKRSAKL